MNARVLGFTLLASWLLFGLCTLLPTPTLTVDALSPEVRAIVEANKSKLNDDIQVTLAINLMLTLFGLVGAIMALRSAAAWKYIVLLGSVFFVCDWWLTSLFVQSGISVHDALLATWVSGFKAHLDHSEFFRLARLLSRDYLLFAVHHIVSIWMLFSIARGISTSK